MTPTCLPKCGFCKNPSTLRCEGRIYDSPIGPLRVPLWATNWKTRACDIPVCRVCATIRIRSRWFNDGAVDKVHLCPECQKIQTVFQSEVAAQ
jgi:hypothetical protein